MGPPSGSYTASGQHSGIDFNGAALTGKRSLCRQTTVETTGTAGKKRRVTLRTKRLRIGNLNNSNNRVDEPLYDKHLLANMGPQRLTALSLKCGTRLGHLPHYERFLKNLNQNGRVVVAWNGTAKSDIDQRHVHMQMFRHRMSNDVDGNVDQSYLPQHNVANADGINLPPSSGPWSMPQYLYPQSSSATYPTAYPNREIAPDLNNPAWGYPGWQDFSSCQAPAPGDQITNAFLQHVSGAVSMSVVTRPDLEDMSWNLNKLKLKQYPTSASSGDDAGASTFAGDGITDPSVFSGASVLTPYIPSGTVTNPHWQDDVQTWHSEKHRRQSIIQTNNYKNAAIAIDADEQIDPLPNSSPAPYLYEAVLRYGTVQYEFMNKNDVGATVEVICYKIKKTAKLSSTFVDYMDPQGWPDSDFPTWYPLNRLFGSIATGYLNTVVDAASTEWLNGRMPEADDIMYKPQFPLLPQLKKTKQSENPFSEIMRNKFVMPAGSRRNVTVELPGEVYDPCNIPLANLGVEPTTAETSKGHQIAYSEIPIADQYTYCVVIAVNGQKMTRFFDGKGQSGFYTESALWKGTFNLNLPPAWSSQTLFIDATTFALLAAYNNVPPGGVPATITLYLHSTTTPGGVPAQFTCTLDTVTGVPGLPAAYIASITNFVMVNSGQNFVVGSAVSFSYSIDPTVVSTIPGYTLGTPAGTIGSMSLTPSALQIRNEPGILPSELPMGDNHGAAHIDYAATYTEHIGACLYKEQKEKSLFAAGQPCAPKLKNPQLNGSSTSSRMILPATSVVRQAERAVATLGSNGQYIDVSVQQPTAGS